MSTNPQPNPAPVTNAPPVSAGVSVETGKQVIHKHILGWIWDLIKSGLTVTGVLAILGCVIWILVYYANLNAKIDNIDPKIEAKVLSLVDIKLGDLRNELKTLASQLEVERQITEYLSQMYGLSCGNDYDAMLSLYDRLTNDPKYSRMSPVALGPLHTKILFICSRTNRRPHLTVAELDRMAKGLPTHDCQGDPRYFLGICYLGKRETAKAQEYLRQVCESPLPIERPNSAVPEIKLRNNLPVFSDSGVVAMILVCELLKDRSPSATAADRAKAALDALDLLVSPIRAIEIKVVLNRLNEIRESPFIREILSGNPGLLVQAYSDLCDDLRKNEDNARVFDATRIGPVRKYVTIESLIARGVLSSAGYSQDCQQPRKDP